MAVQGRRLKPADEGVRFKLKAGPVTDPGLRIVSQ
jgi:hypothetical protein